MVCYIFIVSIAVENEMNPFSLSYLIVRSKYVALYNSAAIIALGDYLLNKAVFICLFNKLYNLFKQVFLS